jgi:hypothetical protein
MLIKYTIEFTEARKKISVSENPDSEKILLREGEPSFGVPLKKLYQSLLRTGIR